LAGIAGGGITAGITAITEIIVAPGAMVSIAATGATITEIGVEARTSSVDRNRTLASRQGAFI